MNSENVREKGNIPKWMQVKKPENERVYHKGNTGGIIKQVIGGTLISIIFITICSYLLGLLYIGPWGGYTISGNSVAFFVFFFLFVVPWVAGMVVHKKFMTPQYSFAILGGFLLGGLAVFVVELYFNPIVAGYDLFSLEVAEYQWVCAVILIMGNLMSQGDWTLKWSHLIYYFIIGAAVSYYNTRVMHASPDVWAYLQFIHLELFMVIAISVKIPQWGFSYFFGWISWAIITMVFFDKSWFTYGLYNFISPLLLTGAVWIYFYRIYKPNRKTMFLDSQSPD